MANRIAHDERFLNHETTPGHPERPQRLPALIDALRGAGLLDQMQPLDFDALPSEQLHTIHDPLYVEQVRDAFADGVRHLDPDTPISHDSYKVARLACGAAVAAADAVMDGVADRVFCALRPPGHHAEHDRAMGFCLFNQIAVAADHLIRRREAGRVAIVDFDVHHGNGTQHAFERRNDVLFISIHQDPQTIFPGTGFARERGKGAGEGYTLNIPVPPGANDGDYERALDEQVLPAVRDFEPRVLLLSAGFDAAAEDPLAQVELTPEAFELMTQQLVEMADKFADGRVISLLEGGYDLAALGRCAAAHVGALLQSR